MKIKRILGVLLIITSFPIFLRLLISIFHPKEGELTKRINWLFGEPSRDWVIEFISAPSYSFLTSYVWSNAFIFFTLWFLWLCLGFWIVYKPNWRKYA